MTRGKDCLYLCRRQKLIISDIWSFWDYAIKKKKNGKCKNEFMWSLLEQARFFFTAAESSPVSSKPLLYYYSFMNLAKLIINMNSDGHGQSIKYQHGLTGDHGKRFVNANIRVNGQTNDERKSNIAQELYTALDGHAFEAAKEINVKNLMQNCVGIHRVFCEIYKVKETFVKVENESLIRTGRNLSYQAKLKDSDLLDESFIIDLRNNGYEIHIDDDGSSSFIVRGMTKTDHITRSDYFELSKKIREKGMWYYLGRSGYEYYISSNFKDRYPPEISIYMIMFFLGYITRYYPHMFYNMFTDKERWLVGEFLATQPKQFLYLATAKIFGQYVYKSYSEL